MKAFAELFGKLDSTTKTNEKVAVMREYFQHVDPIEGAWAVYFLSGRKPRQAVPAKRLRMWAAELANIPDWLFEESYHQVGDLAEAMTLVLPLPGELIDRPLSACVDDLARIRTLSEDEQRMHVLAAWNSMATPSRFVWNKLITGAFRVGVSQLLVTRALAEVSGLEQGVIAHRLMGDWSPTAEFFTQLIAPDAKAADASRPYPFCLAHPLEHEPEHLGDPSHWFAEWKWDGIRAQLIKRAGTAYLWTRGEELVTDRYPELKAMAADLPDGTVLDGEIMPGTIEQIRPFADLQKRIGRKTLTKKLLQEIPVFLMAYDLLEFNGVDWRDRPFRERRDQLAKLVHEVNQPLLPLSPAVNGATWNERAGERSLSRERSVEGLMLKQIDSTYQVGRVRGEWWKWKVNPLSIDAVLIYAQKGHGKRAGLYTDYTFGVWNHGELVTVAKAYSGLTDEEIRIVDVYIRSNTLETFGPVCTVKPKLVFEIGFEGIQESKRHKSGVAVRFPRILRQRNDKTIEQADTLDALRGLLNRSSARSENA